MTTRNYGAMLNEYLDVKMLMQDFIKRDWVLSNISMNNGWKGGKIPVPFRGARASSVEFGQLAASNDISDSVYVRGSLDDYKEVWGAFKLYERDLLDHSGKIPESTFLKLLPQELDSMMDIMKQGVSTQLLNGAHFATFTANGTAGGVIAVDHIDRFQIGQKLVIDDGNSAPLAVYVIAIDMNAETITVSATRGGAAADVSAYTTAQAARCYHPGVLTNGTFNSMRDILLSAANGGSASVHGQTKLAYPHLQAINIDGASWTASNILDKAFDAYTSVRRRGVGNATTILMSYKHLGSIMKLLEAQKGPYVVTKQTSVNVYGWTEIEITTVKGTLKFVGILEADDDVIMYLDTSVWEFYTNGGFRTRKSPEGQQYHEVRETSGFAYITDLCLFGDLMCKGPGNNAIVYGISY